MKTLFASRLKRARTMACLSMDELALYVGISKEAIRKYEHAEAMPNSEKLIKLCAALHIKPDYFFRPEVYEVTEFAFRKKSVLGVKKVSQIKERIKDQLERYLELEDLLALDSAFVNPVDGIVINSTEDIENAAERLRLVWELGFNPINSIIDVLEDHHVKVIEVDEQIEFDGLSTIVNEKIPVIVVNQNFPIERKRFTLLHELGHLILSMPSKYSDKEKEQICNNFAGAVLIPSKIMMAELDHKRDRFYLQELAHVQEEFGVSIQAIMYRAKQLQIISENSLRHFFISLNNNANKKAAVDQSRYCSKESSGRFMQLLYKAIAKELISISKASALSNLSVQSLKSSIAVI
jgi:Zn-dependent peptidase ImmA (M78 family)/DNA-binding XRE family transcriptional regulator